MKTLLWVLLRSVIFLLLLLVGWDLHHQVLRPLLAYCTAPNDRWWWLWSNWWNWQGKPKYSEKTCPIATLSTTNPTWPDPCANTGRRGGKPATNRLSYGAAIDSDALSGGAHSTAQTWRKLVASDLCRVLIHRHKLNAKVPHGFSVLKPSGRRKLIVNLSTKCAKHDGRKEIGLRSVTTL
jgi:hypothetical protein